MEAHVIRREFLKLPGLTGIVGLFTSCSEVETSKSAVPSARTRYDFKAYRENDTLCPVYRITPDDGYYLHTFYDICPWSPSQRYLACTKFPFQDREPDYRDRAEICLIDLEDQSLTEVYSTAGWGFQLGANIQWGQTDRYLYFNDKVDGEGVCVRLDLETGKSEPFMGPMYHLAPDESCIIGFPLDLINQTQSGYGVAVAPSKARKLLPGASEEEGVWRTDLRTGKKELLISLAQAYEILPESDQKKFDKGTFFFFHSKFNPQGTRISQVFRCLLPDSGDVFGVGGTKRVNPTLMTLKSDGSNLRIALPNDVWGKGGHHPNWHPDGEHILMNLKLDYEDLRFCSFRHDGSDFKVLSDTVKGSGHPSFHRSGRYIVSDVYPEESFASRSKEVPIRLVDLETQTEQNLCYMYTTGQPNANVLRVDPHVVWSRDYSKLCFNAAPEGRRQLFVADLSEMEGW